MEMQQGIKAGANGTSRTRVRWGILAILFIITTINYADRATISIIVDHVDVARGW